MDLKAPFHLSDIIPQTKQDWGNDKDLRRSARNFTFFNLIQLTNSSPIDY